MSVENISEAKSSKHADSKSYKNMSSDTKYLREIIREVLDEEGARHRKSEDIQNMIAAVKGLLDSYLPYIKEEIQAERDLRKQDMIESRKERMTYQILLSASSLDSESAEKVLKAADR